MSDRIDAHRSYHLIATACKDGHFRIFKLTPSPATQRFAVECVADIDVHSSEIWRCEWNVSGTVVSSSGDDGRVRLWKGGLGGELFYERLGRANVAFKRTANYLGDWKLLSIVGPDAPPATGFPASVTAPSVASHAHEMED